MASAAWRAQLPRVTFTVHICLQETEKTRWEEQRKTMQQDAQTKAQMAQYEDELARKRGEAEHQKNRERNRELVTLQEQSVRNQEAEKRRIQEQIEGERRATEKYKVQQQNCTHVMIYTRDDKLQLIAKCLPHAETVAKLDSLRPAQ